MPFCDIDKDVSIHYITNSPSGEVTGFDRKKQTIILIPPIFSDADFWLREQLKDPRLSQQYNLVALEQRNMGSTKAPLSPKRDAWVDAADIAMLHEMLQLSPCHVFTVGMNASQAAMKFAGLFPDRCLSLCLCPGPVQAGEDPEWLEHGYLEFVDAYCFPKDLETIERACMELLWFAFNEVKINPDLVDEMVAWWQIHLPPTNRGEFLAQSLCTLQRLRITDAELESIKSPTLFIQGEKSFLSPEDKAQKLCEKLLDARIYMVKGGPQLSACLPEYASVINRVYCQFLSTISPRTEELPSESKSPDPVGVCRAGLARLAEISGDPSIADRTPTILSFSCLSPEVVAQNTVQLAEFTKDQNEAFHALDEHGRPIRKYSERHRDEWKSSAFHRMDNLKQSGLGPQFVSVVETSTSREGSQ